MAFCSKCGTELPENATVCPNCGAAVDTPKRSKRLQIKFHPLVAISFTLSMLSFLFGFIFSTVMMAKKWNIITATVYLVIIPAFVSLSLGLYKQFDENSTKTTKSIALISVAISLLTLVYVFIGYLTMIFG